VEGSEGRELGGTGAAGAAAISLAVVVVTLPLVSTDKEDRLRFDFKDSD
jgi:hypothetical protein